ncbi:MAG: P-II family nitrogen regulator [Syntrophomonadaceae bacterium]|nr:P-II family nitrogen regulator [Syntrophomonadaceae bacterium]
MDNYREFDLILTIVNFGYASQVMEAAKEAGAHGGTVLNARGTGIREAEKYLGLAIQPEKEVVLILVRRSDRQQIMQAISKGAGLNTKGRGLSFSLPVDDVVGVVHLMQEHSE